MEILITEGKAMFDNATSDEWRIFFDAADRQWGNITDRGNQNYIEKDTLLEENFNKVISSNDDIIGLGIRIIETVLRDTNVAPTTTTIGISIQTEVVDKYKLLDMESATNQVGPMIILSKKIIKRYEINDILRYRIGKNKYGKYIVYLHSIYETTIPIKIPRDDE